MRDYLISGRWTRTRFVSKVDYTTELDYNSLSDDDRRLLGVWLYRLRMPSELVLGVNL